MGCSLPRDGYRNARCYCYALRRARFMSVCLSVRLSESVLMFVCICVSRGMWHGPGFIRKILKFGA